MSGREAGGVLRKKVVADWAAIFISVIIIVFYVLS
jgi:hypothetical protein